MKNSDTERWDTVTARFTKALIEDRGKHHTIRIDDPEWRGVDLYWPSETRLPLKEGRLYTFTISMQGQFDPTTGWKTNSRIVKVVHDRMVLYDESLCGIHGTRMHRRTLPITYGEVNDTFLGIPCSGWNTYGRNGYPIKFGGCIVTDDSPKTTRAWVCPNCVKWALEWRAEHGISDSDDMLLIPLKRVSSH